jgi:hypothetical protein
MINNGWVSTHKAMTDCLEEREKFIAQLIADNVKLEAENKRLLKMFDHITQGVNHAD